MHHHFVAIEVTPVEVIVGDPPTWRPAPEPEGGVADEGPAINCSLCWAPLTADTAITADCPGPAIPADASSLIA